MPTTAPEAVTLSAPPPAGQPNQSTSRRPTSPSPGPLPLGDPPAGAREFVRRPAGSPRPRLLSVADEHRLALHTALTAAGVAPVEGDRSAVYAIATLDADAVRSVIAWIGTAAAR